MTQNNDPSSKIVFEFASTRLVLQALQALSLGSKQVRRRGARAASHARAASLARSGVTLYTFRQSLHALHCRPTTSLTPV